MKNSFYLVTPEQKNNKELFASFEKTAVNQWISSVPIADPNLTAQLFDDFIVKFISTKMSAQHRLEIAELIRPLFLSIKESLYSQLTKIGFPKGKDEKKTFNLLVSIEKKFSVGYWLVAQEITRRQVGWLQGKNVTLALQRTIKGLTGIVVTYSIMLLHIPDWIWIDLHSLYKLSVRIKKETVKVPEESNFLGKDSTAEESYIEALLFSLSDSSSLMQKEKLQVIGLISQLSQFVSIEKQPVKSQNIQCIILDEEDRAPYFSNIYNQITDSKVFLNLTTLYSALNLSDQFSIKDQPRFNTLTPSDNIPEKPSLELLTHVLNHWKGEELNDKSLFPDRLDRYITLGVSATHSLQSELNEETNKEVLAKSFSESELSCSSFNEGVLSIGSLISYRLSKDPISQRCLGVVNRILMPKLNGKVIFELSLLTTISYAVSYLKDDANLDDERQKALLYRVKEKTYILMDRYTHNDGDIMRMFMDEKNFLIILGGKKNIGLGYWQFECRRIDVNRVSKSAKKNILGFFV
ncbi:MAG: hypothetical protein KAH20_13250 [Methylococcales bacterium]|nr:hypothetical protein [Methylococcales bacterium]